MMALLSVSQRAELTDARPPVDAKVSVAEVMGAEYWMIKLEATDVPSEIDNVIPPVNSVTPMSAPTVGDEAAVKVA